MVDGQGAVEAIGLRREVWRGRHVFVTGHTGFKGAWTARWLQGLGAEVYGYALAPATDPSLHDLLKTRLAGEWLADLRDAATLRRAVAEARPEIVLHLAAQPLVPQSYRDPVGTWTTNLNGTINLLEALRAYGRPLAAVMVTTDKVYANDESGVPLSEDARLGGDDPYSASKAAAELAIHCWRASFFGEDVRIGTARAGNVIGGGDWSAERLIPDLIRAVQRGEPLMLRRPDASRPWQHVLEPVHGYLRYAEALFCREAPPASLNFGPLEVQRVSVAEIADRLVAIFQAPAWRYEPQPGIAEKGVLALDAGLAARSLGWMPLFTTHQALDATVDWYKAWLSGEDAAAITDRQIAQYEARLRVRSSRISASGNATSM